MAAVNLDKEVQDELSDFADYDIILRPQELIESQVRSSDARSKLIQNKLDMTTSSKFLERRESSKPKERSKEKRVGSQHERKSSSKMKLHKSQMNEKSSVKKYTELDNKFESFLQSAKGSITKKKYESKSTSDESLDQANHKNKTDAQYHKIMDEPAITSQQRYQVLVARDAVIRSKEIKQGDSKRRKVVGSCPDMCPEKERYSRIAKNCLSVLETMSALDATVTSRDANHRLMVKEYSRSSADQQEPLSHELRPISMLMLTMDYLICNIMDLTSDSISLADWYDFIWNRTRSIRKDITQQQLCDIKCVEIIEKCVRFHIHCAEALSEEDTATFDPKINNENLTKCLQTLKHMYHDLQSKGIQCPNEAEFRAYDILLSLTEGETLRLVKDIRKDVLKSPLVKSAFEAALTFKSHNYVKFFKIIERADYLSSCILHRYISEARSRALQIIVRAYSTQHNASMYPTSSFIKDLKFENTEEACDFCRCHGLEADETFITIERRQFTKSATLPASRSSLLVGRKMGDSLGLVINNGELPQNPLRWYQPHDSFDDKNMLKKDSLGEILETGVQKKEVIDLTSEKEEANITTDDKTLSTDSITMQTACSTKDEIPKLKFMDEDMHDLENMSPRQESPKLELMSANMDDLEKARSYLLKKISKLQSLTYEKPKVLGHKSKCTRSSHKTKDKKSAPSKSRSSNSHKSIMFSEDSDSTMQSQHDEPHSEIAKNEKVPLLSNSSNMFGNSHQSNSFAKNNKLISILAANNAPKTVITESLQNSFIPSSTTTPLRMFLKLPSSSPVSKYHTMPPVSEYISHQSVPTMNLKFTTVSPHVTKKSFSSRIDQSNDCSTKPLFSFKCNQRDANVQSFIKKMFEQNEEEESFSVLKESEAFADRTLQNKDIIQVPENKVSERVVFSTADTFKCFDDKSNEVCDRIKRQRSDEINEFVTDLVEELCTECVKDCSVPICKEILMEENMKALLEDELELIRIKLMKKTILKWRFFCERKCQRRLFQNSAHCSPLQSMLLNTPCFTPGVASPLVVYKKQCSVSRITAEKIKKRQEIIPGWEEFNPVEVWNISLLKTFPVVYCGKTEIVKYFKLCLVFPADCDNPDIAIFKDWVHAKFSLSKSQNQKTFSLDNGKAFVSVRVIQLHPSEVFEYKCYMDGITSMILCVPSFTDVERYEAFSKDFASLLDSEILLYPYPLFAFILKSQQTQNSIELTPFIHEKLDAGCFTDFNSKVLFEVKCFKENSNEMLNAVNWLFGKQGTYPSLQKCNFRHYLEDSFTYAFNVLFCKTSLDEYKYLKSMPWHVIKFYNKVLEFKASILQSDLLKRISASWPPEELKGVHPDFKFINKETQRKCILHMKSLSLPCFKGETNSIEDLYKYLDSVTSHVSTDTNMLYIRIKSVLENDSSSLDWLYLINICSLHLINSVQSDFCNSVDVYYAKEDLEAFESDEFWQEVMSDIRKSYLKDLKRKKPNVLESPSKKKRYSLSEETLFIEENSLGEDQPFVSSVSEAPDFLNYQREHIFSPLKNAVAKQMEQSDAFLNHLNETIISGNVLREDLPEEEVISDNEVQVSMKNDLNVRESLFEDSINYSKQQSPGMEFLDDTLSKKSFKEKSFSEIAEQISELQYNIQKNSILEEHFNKLLAKQM